jgi:hypothetical protein
MVGLQSRLVSPGCATGTEARHQPGLMLCFPLVHCLLPWACVCQPPRCGGLGVLNLKLFSTALRCRWPWLRWASEPRPWSLVPTYDDRDSLELFSAATYVQLGNGAQAKFWTNNWLPNKRSVKDSMPTLFSYVRDSRISVAAALSR